MGSCWLIMGKDVRRLDHEAIAGVVRCYEINELSRY